MLLFSSVATVAAAWHQMEDENRAQKRQHLPSQSRHSALYTPEFVPNFNSRKISISSWLFSSSFMCHPPAPPPSGPQQQQSLNPSPRQQKPRRTRRADGRTDGRSRLVEEAQKTLSWPNGRPTLGSAYYDVRQGSSKLGQVGSVNKIHF